MRNQKIFPTLIVVLFVAVSISFVSSSSFAQKKKAIPVCKQAALAALKSLPELSYKCRESVYDSDQDILKWPERVEAIKEYASQLESFTDAAWWQTDVDDLNACDFRGKAGAFTAEEQGNFQEDFLIKVLGNHQIRLVIAPDPCYQTEFNGSSFFVLYRHGGKVSVTKVVDGFFSRINNSISVAFANLSGQQIIEISTGNNMPPSFTNYYFGIDRKSNKAGPKNLFKDGNTLTNQMWSAIVFSDMSNLGLPKSAEAMNVIRGGRLATTFSVYEDDVDGKLNDNGRRLRRIIYRWNGRFYLRSS